MSDLKVLFHEPEELTDRDLGEIRSKLRFMSYAPFVSAGFLGMTSAIVDVHVFRRNFCMRRIAVAATLGAIVGCNISTQSQQSVLPWRNFDQEMLNAHDKRYAKQALMGSGLSSNWVHSGQTTKNPFLRPY